MKRALLATDASEHSLRAARLLGELASHDPELQVTILHVVPLPEVLQPAAAAGAPLTLPARLEDYVATVVPAVMKKTMEALGMAESRVQTMHVIGTATDAILDEVRRSEYDFVIMGRRGLSPLKELFLGSVSQGVLHRANIPVFIVP